MSKTATFELYEVVKVVSTPGNNAPISGEEGAIVGFAGNGAEGWSYGVFIYSKEEVWYVNEAALQGTGRKDRRHTFYDDDPPIRVEVDPTTGEGRPANRQDKGGG